MRSIVVVSVVGVALVASVLVWAQSGGVSQNEPAAKQSNPGEQPEREIVPHCAWYMTSEVNGVYYHYCQVCDGTCDNTEVPAEREHGTGTGCDVCDYEMCSDPINIDVPDDKKRAPAFRSKVVKPSAHIPPRHGRPGDSTDPKGWVYLPARIRHASDSDVVVTLDLDGDERPDRFFRVFHLINEVTHHHSFFGQELDADNPGAGRRYPGYIYKYGDGHRVIIKAPIGEPSGDQQPPERTYNVLAVEAIPIPD